MTDRRNCGQRSVRLPLLSSCILIISLLLLVDGTSADPETVEGLLNPSKRSHGDGERLGTQKKQLFDGPKGPIANPFGQHGRVEAKTTRGTLQERKINFLNERAKQSGAGDVANRKTPNFKPDTFSRPLGGIGQNGRRAFGKYINYPTQGSPPSARIQNPGPATRPLFNQMEKPKINLKDTTLKDLKNFKSSTGQQAPATSTPAVATATSSSKGTTANVNVKAGNGINVNQSGEGNDQLNQVVTKKEDKKRDDIDHQTDPAAKKSISPKFEMLRGSGGKSPWSSSPAVDDEGASEGALAGLLIGITFVVVFAAMAIGLLVHSTVIRVMQRNKNEGLIAGTRRMRPPNEEDGTPPELRSGCGQPAFVQPDGSGSFSSKVTDGMINHSAKSGQPFFNGKLILREVTSGQNGRKLSDGSPNSGGSGGGSLNSSPTDSKKLNTSLGAIPKKMPSPAASVQITDDLISPKYDPSDETTESEEEDSSDDTVYECPGLAASSGEEMVVTNPFFMHDQELSTLATAPMAPQKVKPMFPPPHGIAGRN